MELVGNPVRAAFRQAAAGEAPERERGLVSEGLRKEDERRWESRRARWEERADKNTSTNSHNTLQHVYVHINRDKRS